MYGARFFFRYMEYKLIHYSSTVYDEERIIKEE